MMVRMHRLEARDEAGPARSGTTVTWDYARSRRKVSDPVQTLKLLPDGPVFRLDVHRRWGWPKRYLSVGADSRCNIVIDEPTISALHGFFVRKRRASRLFVEDARSKNGVWVNNVRVYGKVEVASGSLVSLGAALLLACGKNGEKQRPIVSGSTLHEILERAIAIYGSQRKAAEALRIKQATYSRWLAQHRFEPL